MKAASRLLATLSPTGTTRLDVIASQTPLLWRVTPDAVYLVGGAAGPIGGDELSIDLEIGPGATLAVASTAAMIALPGRDSAPSTLRVRVRVRTGGTLKWLPEPTVGAFGCRHRVTTLIDLGVDSRLTWREELIAGRWGEESGSVSSSLRIEVQGRPLLHQSLGIGPDAPEWTSPAVVGTHRAVGSMVIVDPNSAGAGSNKTLSGPLVARMPLPGPGVLVTALAGGAADLRRVLASS